MRQVIENQKSSYHSDEHQSKENDINAQNYLSKMMLSI